MQCIVIETSPERTNARPVTDENGAAHIYATISEARAELKANGYSYNRANDRYYIEDAPEYRAYIIREDSDEYAEIIERIAEKTAEAESLKDVDAYAHDAKTNANAAAWTLDRMTKDHRETAAELARFARTCADLAKDAADNAAASYEHARRTYYADYQTSAYAAKALAIRAEQRDDAQREAQRAEETAQKVEALATVEDQQQREHYAAEAIEQAAPEYIEPATTQASRAAIDTADAAAAALIDAYAEAIGEPTPAYMAKSARLVSLAQEEDGERPAPVHYDTAALMQKVVAAHETDPDALRELFEDLKAGAVYGHQVENVRYPFFWENLSMRGSLIRWSNAGSSANAATMHDLAFVVFQIFKTTPRAFMEEYERRATIEDLKADTVVMM